MFSKASTEQEQDIDFVVTWVDGKDAAWLNQRNIYAQTLQSEVRFRDWGLLKYWFRSVDAFAPWVRKIHFVTWGHIPSWLNTSHPKLHIVKHEDFIPPQYLPTFNSHTIELNLHRIKGLSEKFVYFNDDVFLLRPLSSSAFFQNDLPCFTFGINCIYFGKNSIGLIHGRSLAVINQYFSHTKQLKEHWRKMLSPVNGRKKVVKTILLTALNAWYPGLYHDHTVYPFLRSTYETVWEKAARELDQSCNERFRGEASVSPLLIKFWLAVDGHFVPYAPKRRHCLHLDDNRIEKACEYITNQSFEVLCINDTENLTQVEFAIQKTQNAFQKILPDRCSYEKCDL